MFLFLSNWSPIGKKMMNKKKKMMNMLLVLPKIIVHNAKLPSKQSQVFSTPNNPKFKFVVLFMMRYYAICLHENELKLNVQISYQLSCRLTLRCSRDLMNFML